MVQMSVCRAQVKAFGIVFWHEAQSGASVDCRSQGSLEIGDHLLASSVGRSVVRTIIVSAAVRA